MKILTRIVFVISIFPVLAAAQQSAFQDPLLDSLAGKWVMRGTIAGDSTTHDIDAEWVLAHQYMQIHEVSRERNTMGEPVYEAIVFIGWDRPDSGYDCLWLDVTSGAGLSNGIIGHAKRIGSEIPFGFKGSDGNVFHNTFVYHPESGSWEWRMDGEENGQLQPFARLKLTRQ